ncbi:MAG: efflux RND transporter permease subunit [Bryobacterales bacterium]|nr:efflux RND transporter permease subunit [Bryobacterales bacterium]
MRREDALIMVRLARASPSDLERLKSLKLRGRGGSLVALGEIARIESAIEDKSIYHKNLMPVTCVTAGLAGVIESPVYAMLKVRPEIGRIRVPEGYRIEQYTAGLPPTDTRFALKWDGEWHITYEVFRDLGLAFGAVRFRPMMLTASAVIVGSAVILFDPIFQGLAIALMAGEIASLALSRMTVPVIYFMVNRSGPR